jgi:predicted ATPase
VSDAAQPELAAIVPELDTHSSVTEADAAARVRVFDAAGQTLARAAGRTPVVVILDDLHSADQSSVELMRFVAHQPQLGALMLVGAYRPYEAPPGVAGSLADLASAAELVPLQGLSAEEVADLVRVIAGEAAQDHWPQLVYERSGGHPFYARELCQLFATAGNLTDVPAAVREVIGRRLARLSPECDTVLDAAAPHPRWAYAAARADWPPCPGAIHDRRHRPTALRERPCRPDGCRSGPATARG